MRPFIAIAFTLAAATVAQAGTITVAPVGSGQRPVVMVEGDLRPEDAMEFDRKTASLSQAIIIFSSDGGSLLAGIQIGEIIRLRNFDTVVPEHRRCASACALAWLGGIHRFMFAEAKIGFHAAYDAASGKETGVGNALVGAYLTKLGLSYEAVIYITKSAPDQMTWLNISDATKRGIRVTVLSPSAAETQVVVPTRYGEVIVTKDANECCTGRIRHGTKQVEIVSAGEVYASLEGIYQVKEGDIVIIRHNSWPRGMPDTYYVLLVDQRHMIDVTPPLFATWDGTFRVTRTGNEIQFDLGFDRRRKKSALYKDGVLQVKFSVPGPRGNMLPKDECANVLNMVANCSEILDCSKEGIWDKFAMAGQRYFNLLENMPVFETDSFYSICTSICQSKSYEPRQPRKVLCGY